MELGNNEVWRAIDGYLNYEVSTHGRVRNNKTGRILKPQLQKNGYYSITFSVNGKLKMKNIHRIVCETFNENINNYNLVDHIDRNKLNNFYNNLRWFNNSLNSKNASISSRNTSGIKGVGFCKKSNKWRAYWSTNNKEHVRRFTNKEDAINYRKEMEQLYGYT